MFFKMVGSPYNNSSRPRSFDLPWIRRQMSYAKLLVPIVCREMGRGFNARKKEKIQICQNRGRRLSQRLHLMAGHTIALTLKTLVSLIKVVLEQAITLKA